MLTEIAASCIFLATLYIGYALVFKFSNIRQGSEDNLKQVSSGRSTVEICLTEGCVFRPSDLLKSQIKNVIKFSFSLQQ